MKKNFERATKYENYGLDLAKTERINLREDDILWKFERRFHGNRIPDAERKKLLAFFGLKEPKASRLYHGGSSNENAAVQIMSRINPSPLLSFHVFPFRGTDPGDGFLLVLIKVIVIETEQLLLLRRLLITTGMIMLGIPILTEEE